MQIDFFLFIFLVNTLYYFFYNPHESKYCYRGILISQYDRKNSSPLTWWMTCEDIYNHLQDLAIKLFSVTPHSVGCERIFSKLNWIYGNKHQNLNLEKLEDMSKILSYYLSNTKKEVRYFGHSLSDNELKQLIINS